MCSRLTIVWLIIISYGTVGFENGHPDNYLVGTSRQEVDHRNAQECVFQVPCRLRYGCLPNDYPGNFVGAREMWLGQDGRILLS